MNTLRLLKVVLFAVPFVLGSCKTAKQAYVETPQSAEKVNEQHFLLNVADNAQKTKFITSKVKFSVEVGVQKMALTGNLKMKRNDVIRLQLMAFGFVEAARIEFTPEYVLVLDRINKLYLKATYYQLDFLRNSGLNFYSLQSLFWNELFMPGADVVTDETLKSYNTTEEGNDIIISYEKDRLSYRWLAEKGNATIRMSNILCKNKLDGNSQLTWDYTDFKPLDGKMYPNHHEIQLMVPSKTLKLSMNFNYVGHDDEWDTRTKVSGKYREVSIDEILRRFMAL